MKDSSWTSIADNNYQMKSCIMVEIGQSALSGSSLCRKSGIRVKDLISARENQETFMLGRRTLKDPISQFLKPVPHDPHQNLII